MRSRLLNLSAAMSLFLVVAALVVWVRSYYVADFITLVSESRQCREVISCGRGRLWYQRYDLLPHVRPIATTQTYLVQDENYFINLPPLPGVRFAGFEIGRQLKPRSGTVLRETRVIIPLYALALVAALLPATWLVRRFRTARRRKRNLCASCGYDLRATPDRCPECGAVPRPQCEPPHNPPMQRTATAGAGAVE